MTGLFTRLFRVFQAEANATMSRLEDPVKLSEQGLRDLKSSLSEAMISLAQVKSVAIRMCKEAEDEKRRAKAYEHKAVALLTQAQKGQLEPAEADRLASEVLSLKSAADGRYSALKASAEQQEQQAARLQSRVERLRREVGRFEDELVTLRARATTARSSKKISQHLAGADGSSTVAMLKRMRDKVVQEEALAEAYEQLYDAANDAANKTVETEREVDRALSQTSGRSPQATNTLAELKAQLGIEP